jgi:hypothetical protein
VVTSDQQPAALAYRTFSRGLRTSDSPAAMHQQSQEVALAAASRATAVLDVLTGGVIDPDKVVAELLAMSLSMDVLFTLVSGYLVFLMQAGFAMLTAGSVRTKNTKNVLLKNVLDACVGSVAYFLFGHAFAYGPGGNKFVGFGNFALSSYQGEAFNLYHTFFFQWAFAATAATIVSGSVAERTSFNAYIGMVVSAIFFECSAPTQRLFARHLLNRHSSNVSMQQGMHSFSPHSCTRSSRTGSGRLADGSQTFSARTRASSTLPAHQLCTLLAVSPAYPVQSS